MFRWATLFTVGVLALAVLLYFMTRPPQRKDPAQQADQPGIRTEPASPEPARATVETAKPESIADPKPRFEKLDSAGGVLSESALSWECVRDNENALVWEVKQDNGGLRDLDFTYSWYTSHGDDGVADGGNCFYIFCDTQSLVEAVNKEGLCGWRDWRLPSNVELMTLDTDRLYYDPDIDQRYFPNTRSGYYWTSTPAEVGPLRWSINFLNGFPEVSPKRLAYHVRLVRSD